MSKGTINIDERLPEESVTSSTTIHIRELEARLEKEKADAESERRRREEDDKARRRREDILFMVSVIGTVSFFIFGVYIYFFAPNINPNDKDLAKTITTMVVSGVIGYALGGRGAK